MSWLSDILHYHRRRRDSPELAQAKLEAATSHERLQEVLEKRERVDKVVNSLQYKKYKNGWGEVIAETMRRAK